jgi:hypothetical protein
MTASLDVECELGFAGAGGLADADAVAFAVASAELAAVSSGSFVVVAR